MFNVEKGPGLDSSEAHFSEETGEITEAGHKHVNEGFETRSPDAVYAAGPLDVEGDDTFEQVWFEVRPPQQEGGDYSVAMGGKLKEGINALDVTHTSELFPNQEAAQQRADELLEQYRRAA